MFDLKFIRENPDAFDAGLARRGLNPRAGEILALDSEARKYTQVLNDLQTKRNAASKQIGAAKAKGDEDEFKRLMAEVESVKAQMPTAEAEEKKKRDEIKAILEALPNLPAKDVPDGEDESANVELRKWGEPNKPNSAKEHFDLGENLGQMDFETAAKMSGARFVLLSGGLARLERAIAAFMLDTHTQEFGYTEVSPPVLVRDEAMYGTGQLPKFAEDSFQAKSSNTIKLLQMKEELQQRQKIIDEIILEAKDDIRRQKEMLPKGDIDLNRQVVGKLNTAKNINTEAGKVLEEYKSLFEPETVKGHWLIPTAEVALTNMVREEIVDEDTLPRRYTAHTPCFRSEAGSAGRDTRGMIRLHQFNKVELVSITTPEKSNEEHERMTECAEAILKKLELPYRTMVLSAGDMGFGARKTYDLEVWLPGQGQYREISSCSNCGDFQSRRMNARYRVDGEKALRFPHTLNGSGLAVGRTLVAILENYQQEDGSVAVPEVLQGYLGGLAKIEKA